MKLCNTCNQSLPLDNFYDHPNTLDGKVGKCQECCKKYARDRRKSLKTKRLERQQIGAAESVRRWRNRNQHKRAAHKAVEAAVKTGQLKPQPCERCGAKGHAHHDDYSKPLDVRWLCAACHRLLHAQMERMRKINAAREASYGRDIIQRD